MQSHGIQNGEIGAVLRSMQIDPRALIAGSLSRFLSDYQPREAVRGAVYVARRVSRVAKNAVSGASKKLNSVLKAGSK